MPHVARYLSFHSMCSLQHTATHCNTLQHTGGAARDASCRSTCWNPTQCNTATHCSTLQHTATHCNTLQHTYGAARDASYRSTCWNSTQCNTLQHTAAHCSTLQHTATHCNTFMAQLKMPRIAQRAGFQHNATHCNTLQHTATHLWRSSRCLVSLNVLKCNTLQHTATHCNTLQHTATHCNTPMAQLEMPRIAARAEILLTNSSRICSHTGLLNNHLQWLLNRHFQCIGTATKRCHLLGRKREKGWSGGGGIRTPPIWVHTIPHVWGWVLMIRSMNPMWNLGLFQKGALFCEGSFVKKT